MVGTSLGAVSYGRFRVKSLRKKVNIKIKFFFILLNNEGTKGTKMIFAIFNNYFGVGSFWDGSKNLFQKVHIETL